MNLSLISRTFLVLAAFSASGGCSLYGPQLTPTSHLAYNEAVQESQQRELLLNLVRLRYLDAPEFLSIGSISSQTHFDTQASLSGAFGDDRDSPSRMIMPGASVQYSEAPTVTFVPEHGEEFMRRLVSPISLDSLYLLTRYGWSLERVLSLTTEEINGVTNPATREGITEGDATAIVKFSELVHTLQVYYERHLIDIEIVEQWLPIGDYVPSGGVTVEDFLSATDRDVRLVYDGESRSYALQSHAHRYALEIAPEASDSLELIATFDRLGLRPGNKSVEINSAPTIDKDDRSITIRTRSVLSAMAYLSNGVTVPEADLENGIAGPNLLGEHEVHLPIRILSAAQPPPSAFISVPYRGNWFFIENGDLGSRRTLGALSSLVRLEIGAGRSQVGPILTLPVAR